MAESKVPELVLASGSPTRRKLLEAAGLDFKVVRPSVDEDVIRGTMRADNDFGDIRGIDLLLGAGESRGASGLHLAPSSRPPSAIVTAVCN